MIHRNHTVSVTARPRNTLLPIIVGMLVPLALPPDPGFAAPFSPAPTVFGQSGTVTVGSPDVLSPSHVRVGLITHVASGSAGNSVDLLLGDDAGIDTVAMLRGAIALGLPGKIEVAVTAPYTNVEIGDISSDGLGDTTLSAKRLLWDQSGWRPAAAVSASWIAETNRDARLSSVTTNGYRATISGELGLVSRELPWWVVAELGGFWRDPSRPESDSSLVYGLAIVVPLARAGLLEDAGELQFIAEGSGTSARRSLAHEPDDSLSFVPGFRYVADSWGATISGVFTTYERTDKEDGTGGLLAVHIVF